MWVRVRKLELVLRLMNTKDKSSLVLCLMDTKNDSSDYRERRVPAESTAYAQVREDERQA